MKNLNLLPDTNKKKNEDKRFIISLIKLFAIIFLMIILIVGILYMTNRIIYDKILLVEESINNDFKESQLVFKELNKAKVLNEDLNVIKNKISREEKLVSEKIKLVSSTVPEDVFLFKISYDNLEDSFFLDCISKKEHGAAEFISNLQLLNHFSKISLESIEIDDEGNEFFSIKIYDGVEQSE